jgi:hypothetical protein
LRTRRAVEQKSYFSEDFDIDNDNVDMEKEPTKEKTRNENKEKKRDLKTTSKRESRERK